MSAQPPFKNQIPDAETETKKSGYLWLIIIVLILIAGGSGAAWYFLGSGDGAKSTESTDEAAQTEVPLFVELEPFTVNLQSDGQYLQVTFVVEIGKDTEKELLKLHMPQIRSRILLMLSSKSVDELSRHEGKTALIAEVKKLIEQPFGANMEPIMLRNVYITAFIIQ